MLLKMTNLRYWHALLLLFLIPAGIWAQMTPVTETESREYALAFESQAIVRMGSKVVTQADVDAFLAARVPEEDRGGVLMSADRIGQLLHSLLLRQGLAALARDAGLLEQPLVQAQLVQAVDQALSAIYQDHFLAQIELDDYEDLAREIFLTNRSRFMGVPAVDFRHVLIGVDGIRTEAEAMQRTLELHGRITSGESIADLAEAYSDDPTVSDNGGLFENVPSDQIVSQVRFVVDNTPLGELADPVRSQFGWHLVVPVARHDPEPLSWEQARDQALDIAIDRHQSTAVERLLRDLQDSPPDFVPGSIEELRRRYGVSGEDAPTLEAIREQMGDNVSGQ